MSVWASACANLRTRKCRTDGLSIGEFVDSEHGHCGLRAGTSTGSLSECVACTATGASSGNRNDEEGRHVAGTTPRSDGRNFPPATSIHFADRKLNVPCRPPWARFSPLRYTSRILVIRACGCSRLLLLDDSRWKQPNPFVVVIDEDESVGRAIKRLLCSTRIAADPLGDSSVGRGEGASSRYEDG